jgi:uncharacterized membrane protein (DUF485 family)
VTAETPGPASGSAGGLDNGAYVRLSESPEFARLRRTFRRFVFPMTAAFLIWYLLYVVLSAYARDFMGTKVVGEINVALVFGLLQFLTTFLIAWAYERYSNKTIEPLAEAVVAQAPGVGGGAAATVVEAPAPEAPAAPAAEEAPEAEASEPDEPSTEKPDGDAPKGEENK